MTGKYTVIETTAHPMVTHVRFYEETRTHIEEQHPEVRINLPSVSNAVATAIQAPTVIEQGHTNTLVFVDHSSSNRGGEPLRVPVKIIEGTSALLKTAFFASGPTNPRVLWRKL